MKRRNLHSIVLLMIGSWFCSVALATNTEASYSAIKPASSDAAAPPVYVPYPTINYGTGAAADLIKRGEYLVKAGDCIACHTNKPNGEIFAGGLPFKTPFGTIYSSNITPDKVHGIGNWTDAQFLKSLRHGIRPDGTYNFPVFPYIYFNRLSDDDALAIRAYLNQIPAISKPNLEPDMPFPFRWRFGQLFWRLLFFTPYQGEFKPDPSQNAQWNRGKYLVNGLGHCGMCHSPLNFLGAEKRAYYLTGGFVESFYAPNITSSNLGNEPIDTIVNVFLKNEMIGGGNVVGPMLEVNHYSLSQLNRTDLEAIATYLKTVKSKEPPKPEGANTVSLKAGAKVYNTYCTGCHTTGAGGAPKLGDQAAWSPLIKLGMDTLYKNAMNGMNGMPAKGTCSSCTLIDIQSAVNYIVSQSQGAAGSATVAAQQAKPVEDPTSIEKGKLVYNRVCSTCHTQGQLGAPKLGDQATWSPLIKQGMDVLFHHAIEGYNNHPIKGACDECTDADVIAATKYMVQQSKTDGDYRLW